MTSEIEMWTKQKEAELRLDQLNTWLRDAHSVDPEFPVEVTSFGDAIRIHDMAGGFFYVLKPRQSGGDTIFYLETDPVGEIKNPMVVELIEKSGFKLWKERSKQLRGVAPHTLEVGESFFVQVECGLGDIKKNFDVRCVSEDSSAQAGTLVAPQFSHVYFKPKRIGTTEIVLGTPNGEQKFTVNVIEPKAETANRSQKTEVILALLEDKFPNELQGKLWDDRKKEMLQVMTSQELRKLLNSLNDDNEYRSCMQKVVGAISDARQQRRYENR